MRVFAWLSVKLFAPAAGAPGLLCEGLAIAGVCAFGLAGGPAVWAKAAGALPNKRAIAAVAKRRFIVLSSLLTPTTTPTDFPKVPFHDRRARPIPNRELVVLLKPNSPGSSPSQ